MFFLLTLNNLMPYSGVVDVFCCLIWTGTNFVDFSNFSIVSVLYDVNQNLIFDVSKSCWKIELLLFKPFRDTVGKLGFVLGQCLQSCVFQNILLMLLC